MEADREPNGRDGCDQAELPIIRNMIEDAEISPQ
jgi:hypothetical protein